MSCLLLTGLLLAGFDMKTNVASEGDILPTDGGHDGNYLALGSVIPLTLRADPAFLRLDHSIAELCVLAESVHRHDGNLDNTAERYASFYEKAERIIVRLLNFSGIEVDAQRISPFQHSYHESVLQILADKGNIFYHILGSVSVQYSLRHAKTFRNKYRSGTHSANELLSYEGPGISNRALLVARAIKETSEFARTTVIDSYLDSRLSQLLDTHTVERATPEFERISRNWLTIQGLEPRNPLSTATESQFRSELGSNGHNNHERVRSALLEAFTSRLSILQRTLDDVSYVVERVPKNGEAQEQFLHRFVSSRLDKLRQKARGGLDTLMGELSAHAVDLMGARTNRVVELETLNGKLRIRVVQSETRLRIKTAEARKVSEQVAKLREENTDFRMNLQRATSNYNSVVDRSQAISNEHVAILTRLGIKIAKARNVWEQVTKLREETTNLKMNLQRATSDYNNAMDRSKIVFDEHITIQTRLRIKTTKTKKELEQLTKVRKEDNKLRLNLQRATSDYNSAVNHSKAVSDEHAAIQSQLDVECKSHKAHQTRTAALEGEKQLFVESCADDVLTIRRLLDILSTNIGILQEETPDLRVELAAERSSRKAADAKAILFEDEVNSIQTGMESMLRRPRSDKI